ncbi:magnesium transporter CorA family protein [Furfurilactobacillus sp. WILCCON 0119]|uniref:magnesium transporter CorA family protein n=1 Tax=Furfurilactobacillus entadae TaxID=2922307 RepID=UPI0035EBD67A
MLTPIEINNNFEWVNVQDETAAEHRRLIQSYKLTEEMYGYATDPNERARVEIDKETGISLIIFNVLTDEDVENATAPIGFLFKGKRVFTFTSGATNYVQDLVISSNSALKLPPLEQQQPIDAILGLLYKLTTNYLNQINGLDRQRAKIQHSLKTNPEHSAINELMDIETRLVYYLTSLKTNTDMLQDFKRIPVVPISTDQEEHLMDIVVESQQGLEMAQMTSDVVERVSNAYSNLIDNNLNNTMKFLTAYSVIMTVPTIVSGFFGQNVPLPFEHLKFGWQITVAITALLGYVVYLILKHYKLFDR